ncbi:unnamed protein product [Fraxinus pennsylvanica]|uniref:Retrovirus-related Pol polyprotein from transposon TNT 1-94 n=1 Tax=Fraxinus pennsylvanica TaxID=56036 RepID=A0AAD2E0A3_9LAMI|nr:unnamed protein product [Fraxinus pennsylvanica]
MNLATVISEVNMVGSNPKEWWIDTGAMMHVCSDKKLFTTFETIENGEKLFMGNSTTSEIKGQGKLVLKMTSGNELTLNNVLYVPKICKNLVSGSLLNKYSFRIVFESNKVILSKSGMFVEKVVILTPKKVKIGPKIVDCIFIGYAHDSSAYQFLVYESKISDIHKNTIMESRNASFFEHVFPYKSKEEASYSKQTYDIMIENSQGQEQEEDVEVQPRRSKREKTEKSYGPDFLTYMLESEPQNYQETVNFSKGPQWKEAIKSEIDSILQNHT